MLKIAVLGTGFIGSVHAKNVASHPGTELAAVYDVNVEFAKRAAATTGTKGSGRRRGDFRQPRDSSRGDRHADQHAR